MIWNESGQTVRSLTLPSYRNDLTVGVVLFLQRDVLTPRFFPFFCKTMQHFPYEGTHIYESNHLVQRIIC